MRAALLREAHQIGEQHRHVGRSVRDPSLVGARLTGLQPVDDGLGQDVAKECVAPFPFPIEFSFSHEQEASESLESERRGRPKDGEGKEIDVGLHQPDVSGGLKGDTGEVEADDGEDAGERRVRILKAKQCVGEGQDQDQANHATPVGGMTCHHPVQLGEDGADDNEGDDRTVPPPDVPA